MRATISTNMFLAEYDEWQEILSDFDLKSLLLKDTSIVQYVLHGKYCSTGKFTGFVAGQANFRQENFANLGLIVCTLRRNSSLHCISTSRLALSCLYTAELLA